MPLIDAERRAPGRGTFSVGIYLAAGTFLSGTFKTLWHLRVSGREHVPTTGAFILAPNHQSMLDPVICGIAAIDRPFTYIARESLFHSKAFGALIRLFGAVPIERNSPDSGAIRTALAELAAGRALLLYPEGTRTYDGRIAPLKPGVVLLARRAKVPLVPLAVEGSYDVWPRKRNFPRLTGYIEAELGKPISPDELKERLKEGNEAFLEGFRHEVEEMRMRCRERLRERTRGAWPPPGIGDTPYWSA